MFMAGSGITTEARPDSHLDLVRLFPADY